MMFSWKCVACDLFLVFCFIITYLCLSGHDHQVKYHSSISLLFCLTFLALPVLYLCQLFPFCHLMAFLFSSAYNSLSCCFRALWLSSELCGCLSDRLWVCFCMGGENVLGWVLVNCLQIAMACSAPEPKERQHYQNLTSTIILCVCIWNICLCSVYLSLSGAAKDHRTTWLWGCGVSEKGSDPQRPSPRPAALPCGRCLGESLHPLLAVSCPLGLALTQVIFLSCAVYPVVCCL